MQLSNPGFAECVSYLHSFNEAPDIVRLDPVFQANYSCYAHHVSIGRYTPSPAGHWGLANERHPWSPLGSLSEINLAVTLAAGRGLSAIAAVSARAKQTAGCDLDVVLRDTRVTVSVKTATSLQIGSREMVLSGVAFDKVRSDCTSEMVAFVHNINEAYLMMPLCTWNELTSIPANVHRRESGHVEIQLGDYHTRVKHLIMPTIPD